MVKVNCNGNCDQSCSACDALDEVVPEIWCTGITEKMCESLGDDTGLNPDLPEEELHNDCQDLNNLNDCGVGGEQDNVMGQEQCNWREYLSHILIPNIWTMFKTIICTICGMWEAIHNLEKATYNYGLDDEFPLIPESYIYDVSETMKGTGVVKYSFLDADGPEKRGMLIFPNMNWYKFTSPLDSAPPDGISIAYFNDWNDPAQQYIKDYCWRPSTPEKHIDLNVYASNSIIFEPGIAGKYRTFAWKLHYNEERDAVELRIINLTTGEMMKSIGAGQIDVSLLRPIHIDKTKKYLA
ncbi:hypothetical protein M2139_001631 [Enterococcus sp. PF1-24]|uniref:hypothetical protein n=1 Tax=unclassified Enterococcus TaxID=2608891 RepID=UPI00247590EB|nr:MULTISPECIES: hypothetical protein [unclassified Enterococcus]MDH6364644.1 hypothetical protein [Enterococcus sp. PFB1-1]MDH6401745.1 hypothetical protein [Enterococcus sp. PF1-24]